MTDTTPLRLSFITDAPDPSTFATGGPDDPPPTSRIQVAKTGRFRHPVYGRFTVNAGTIDSMVRNFAAGRPTDRLPGDLDHAPDRGSGSTQACGWITELHPQDGALF